MEIRIIDKQISVEELAKLAQQQFGNLIKATVDVRRKVMALGGDLHADEEQLLLGKGSSQQDLWGINLYPARFGTDDFIEFDSMINLRPSQGNMSRGVEDIKVQEQIEKVVAELIKGEK